MKQLLLAISAAAMAFGTSLAMADDPSLINDYANNDLRPLTPAQSAQMKAERDAAKAKYAAMTPAEKAAAKQSAQSKKLGDMTAIERLGVNDDLTAMTKAETAQAKAQHDAAKAKWDTMTPEQKAASRKATQQKRLAEMNEMERHGANDDIGRWATGY